LALHGDGWDQIEEEVLHFQHPTDDEALEEEAEFPSRDPFRSTVGVPTTICPAGTTVGMD